MSETIINGIIEESQEMSGQIQYARGAKGDDGVGIQDIQKTATVGKVDTYTITLTDGTTKTFTVTNGNDGANGVSVTTASINVSGHLIVTLSNGVAVDAGQAKGEKGDAGDSGVYIGTTPPTDPDVKVWIDISGEAGDVEMTANKTTAISASSTNTQYPSAKAVYDALPIVDQTYTIAEKNKLASLETASATMTYPPSSTKPLSQNGVYQYAMMKRNMVVDTASTSKSLTASENTDYVFGELTGLTLSFNIGYNAAKEIDILFKSGATATTLTVSTQNAIFESFVPSANTYVEINAKWCVDKWVVLFNEVSAS